MRPLALAALLTLLAGCSGEWQPECGRDAHCTRVPDRFYHESAAWFANATVSPAVRLTVEPGEGGAFVATVRNSGDAPLLAGGTDCSLWFARPTPDGWELFLPFPGNYLEVLLRIEPGASCVHEATEGDSAAAGLEPGTYRLVFFAREGEHEGQGVLAWAPFEAR